MYCKYCGAQLPEGSTFCSACGKQAVAPETAIVPAPSAQTSVKPTTVLVLGIVGLALCECGVAGIIVSAIGRSKAKKLEQETNAPLTGKAKVGGILAKVGLIVSIVYTAICAVAGIVLGILYSSLIIYGVSSGAFEEFVQAFRAL